MDSAQKTRFISVDLKFDVNCWAKWAENEGIDGRCINFLLLNEELVTKDVNARSITTFFNAISGIPDFEKELALIKMIGEGSVGSEFSSLFVTFIANKLDKLVTPKYLVRSTDPTEKVLESLSECLTDSKTMQYNSPIASLLATRVINFSVKHYTTTGNTMSDEALARMVSLMTKSAFTDDLKYTMVSGLMKEAKTKFTKLFMNPEIIKMLKT